MIRRDVINLIFPPRCVGCGNFGMEDQPEFCRDCSAELNELSAGRSCDRCAMPLGAGAACPYCGGRGVIPLRRIVALGPFRGTLRRMIHRMKFRHRWTVAEILADRLLREDRVRHLLAETDVLAPVPLHWRRQIARGYNQSAAIAHRLAQSFAHLRVIHPVIRCRDAPPQSSLRARSERWKNVRDVFAPARRCRLDGLRVTLVDDVCTTASTLKSAARAVQLAGPARIDAIVLAIADPRRRDFQQI